MKDLQATRAEYGILLLPGAANNRANESRLLSPALVQVLWEGSHEDTGQLATQVLHSQASTVTSLFWEQEGLFNSRRDWRGTTLQRRDADRCLK